MCIYIDAVTVAMICGTVAGVVFLVSVTVAVTCCCLSRRKQDTNVVEVPDYENPKLGDPDTKNSGYDHIRPQEKVYERPSTYMELDDVTSDDYIEPTAPVDVYDEIVPESMEQTDTHTTVDPEGKALYGKGEMGPSVRPECPPRNPVYLSLCDEKKAAESDKLGDEVEDGKEDDVGQS